MKTFFRWLLRAVFALLLAGLATGIWIAWRFEQWKKQTVSALQAGAGVIETASGPMEYVELGDRSGPAVLISHGAPGGYDQAALIGAPLAKAGFRVIAPSRPGFLRTPLTTGLLFDDQADAFASLLDKLGIKEAAVLGFSTGAQPAVRFALRHPDRTRALVLVSPLTLPYQRDIYRDPRQLLPDAALFKTTGDMGAWLLIEKSQSDPRTTLDAVLAIDTSLDAGEHHRVAQSALSDPARLEFLRKLLGTQAPLSSRESGTRNDLILARTLEPVPYEKLQPPVLIVQGKSDAAAKWNDPKVVADKLPSARVLTVDDAGQIIWLGPAAAAEKTILDFLKSPPARRPAPSPTPETPAEKPEQ